MSGSLSHDFKNQLGIILGFVELMMCDLEESDPRRADLFEVQKAAERMQSLLPQVLSTPDDR